MKYLITLCILPVLISSCIPKHEDRETPGEYTELNSGPENPAELLTADLKTDEPVIIGGYTTRYKVWEINSISQVYIFIEEDMYRDLTGIEQLINIKWLSISIRRRGEVDFTPLYSLPKIHHLDIGGVYVNQVPDLSGVESLTDLKIQFANLTSLDGIERIPNLERLEVRDNHQPIADTSALRHTRNLKFLEFFDDTYTLKMSDISELTVLEELRIAVYREHDLTGIGALRSLKKLYVAGHISERTDERNPYEEIGELAGLTELEIDAVLPSVDFLAKNVNLESLTLKADTSRKDFFDRDKLLALDLTPLTSLKKLKYLRIQGFTGSFDHDALPELEYYNADLYAYE